MSARQPTIIATSIGFQPDGPDTQNLGLGPSFDLAAELARAGSHPRVCIIATAVGDSDTRAAAVHNAFGKAGWISTHLALFTMPTFTDLRSHLLALWRAHGLDLILRQCWESGVVLTGVSAGSLCWHVGGTTDSFGLPLRAVTDALGFLPYSNSPHHDAEPERRPLIHRLIADGTLPDGFATENGTGLVFFGAALHEAFTEQPDKTAYSLTRRGDTTVERALPTRLL